MSTELGRVKGSYYKDDTIGLVPTHMDILRFNGGKKGTCISLNIAWSNKSGCIQLTKRQTKKLIEILKTMYQKVN